MNICHTGPLKVLVYYPELTQRFGPLIVQKEVVEVTDEETIRKFKLLKSEKEKEVVLWSQNKEQKSNLLSLMVKIDARKVILPAEIVDDVKRIENEKPQTSFLPIISITSQNRRDFIATLNYSLNSKIVSGIGIDVRSVSNVYSQLCINPSGIRPRLLKQINELFGLRLYHKDVYCLGSLGGMSSLSEIYELNRLGFVHTLVTDAAFMFAFYNTFIGGELEESAGERYKVDKGINFELKNLDLVKENIKSMEKHNEG